MGLIYCIPQKSAFKKHIRIAKLRLNGHTALISDIHNWLSHLLQRAKVQILSIFCCSGPLLYALPSRDFGLNPNTPHRMLVFWTEPMVVRLPRAIEHMPLANCSTWAPDWTAGVNPALCGLITSFQKIYWFLSRTQCTFMACFSLPIKKICSLACSKDFGVTKKHPALAFLADSCFAKNPLFFRFAKGPLQSIIYFFYPKPLKPAELTLVFISACWIGCLA